MADTPFNWTQLIGPAATLGGQFLTNRSNQAMSKAQLAQQEHQFEVTQGNKQAEVNRRNMLFGAASPMLLRNLGYNPSQINPMVARFNQPEMLGRPAGNYGSPNGYATPQSTASKVIGGIGKGLGVAGAVGGAAGLMGASLPFLGALGPIGAIGAGALGVAKLVNKIGEGRRTANMATNVGGLQNNFENYLKQVGSDPSIPEAQKWQLYKQYYDQTLTPQALQFASVDDTHKKVINQMFDKYNSYWGWGNPLRGQQ